MRFRSETRARYTAYKSLYNAQADRRHRGAISQPWERPEEDMGPSEVRDEGLGRSAVESTISCKRD